MRTSRKNEASEYRSARYGTQDAKAFARRVVEQYGGEVPREMDDLLSLPGVARKTANVVRGECFGLADGVVVDTHVARITGRLGFTNETDPVKIERDLMELVPRRQWILFSHRLIRFGRSICDARRPPPGGP